MPYGYIYFSEFTPDEGREYPIGTFTVTGFMINGSGVRDYDDSVKHEDFLFKISEMDILHDEAVCTDPNTVYLTYTSQAKIDEGATGIIKLKFKNETYVKAFTDSFIDQQIREVLHVSRQIAFVESLKKRDEQIAALSGELQEMTQKMGALVEKLQKLKENTYDYTKVEF